MPCRQCGKETREGTSYCFSCGKPTREGAKRSATVYLSSIVAGALLIAGSSGALAGIRLGWFGDIPTTGSADVDTDVVGGAEGDDGQRAVETGAQPGQRPPPPSSATANTISPSAAQSGQVGAADSIGSFPPYQSAVVDSELRKQSGRLNDRGMAAYKQKDYKTAEGLFIEALNVNPGAVTPRYNLACVFALLKHADQALEQLKQLKDAGCDKCEERMQKAKTDPDFNFLRDDTRFKALVGVSGDGPYGLPPKPSEVLLNPQIAEAKASSDMSNHKATDAFDGNPRSAWNENSRGPGDGEWIEARFDSPRRIKRLVFSTGFDFISEKHGDLFAKNSRLQKYRIEFDGGKPITGKAEADQHTVELDGLDVTTTRVRLVAVSVYSGEKWPDLCVSEFEIYGTADGPSPPRGESNDSGDPGENAMKAYRDQITAFNSPDKDRYFAHYADVLNCFYNKADVPLDDVRKKRSGLLLGREKSEWTINSLEVKRGSADEVLLDDKSTHRDKDGKVIEGDRWILLRNIRGTWKIVVEADKATRKCFKE